MQLRKKILSYFLLSTYILVLLHQTVFHAHNNEVSNTLNTESHQHEDFEKIHHEHQFHVGVFHFVSHLFEHVSHSDDHSDTPIALIIQKAATKKISIENNSIVFYTNEKYLEILSVDSESLPDPPTYHLFLLNRLLQLNTPLRAPPLVA